MSRDSCDLREPVLIPGDPSLCANRHKPSPFISPSLNRSHRRSRKGKIRSGFSVSPKSRLLSTPPSRWSRRYSRAYRISPPFVSRTKLKGDLPSIEHLNQHQVGGGGAKEKREKGERGGLRLRNKPSRSWSFAVREKRELLF